MSHVTRDDRCRSGGGEDSRLDPSTMGYENGWTKLRFAGLSLALAASMVLPAAASGQTATQALTIDIRPINRIAVAGTTTFTIPAKKAGASTTVAASATYAITTNEDNRRITVAIDEPLPEGVTLKMKMDAPSGAQAAEELTLSTSPQIAVSGISRLNARELAIGYSLVAGSSAVVPTATTRTVKVTLVSAP